MAFGYPILIHAMGTKQAAASEAKRGRAAKKNFLGAALAKPVWQPFGCPTLHSLSHWIQRPEPYAPAQRGMNHGFQESEEKGRDA